MKKYFSYALTIILACFILTSCEDSLDDVKDEVQKAIEDGEINDPNLIQASDLVYTLTEEDYETLNVDSNAFNSIEDVKALIPALLDNKYSGLSDKGESLALITYNINTGDAFFNYSLTAADYTSLRTPGYIEESPAIEAFEISLDADDVTDHISNLLTTNNPNAKEGDAAIVNFKTFTEASSTTDGTVYYKTDLTDETKFNEFENISVTGEATWQYDASYGAKISGFKSGTDYENEDWLISPAIDLTGIDDAGIIINQALNFLDGTYLNKVMISKNHTIGSYAASTWNEITFTTLPTGKSWDFVKSEFVDLSSYANETIHIAFVYDYPDGDTPTWEVDELAIQAPSTTTTEIDYEDHSNLFIFTGSAWEIQAPIQLETADYDAMGEAFGYPGRYDNFSSSISPDDYLPTYLNINKPYATEGDVAYVEYAYYSGGLTYRISVYNYSNGEWLAYNGIEQQSLQFGLEDGIWVPDNTIAYTLVDPTDYEVITSSALAENPDYANQIDSVKNYANFDRRVGNSAYWNDEMIEAAMIIFLDDFDPDAELGQKYSITFATWNPGDGTETFKFIKDKDSGNWKANN